MISLIEDLLAFHACRYSCIEVVRDIVELNHPTHYSLGVFGGVEDTGN
jgi:hypothetical protein